MEAQQSLKMRYSFKKATIMVCFFNVVIAILLLQHFLFPFSSRSSSNHLDSVRLRYIKESEEIRRAMLPLELIRRVGEIEFELNAEPVTVQEKDTKQTAAHDLSKRLNNVRSFSDPASMKVLEEWRKRKMERARQRELGRNATVAVQA